jgi:hypothetical protein
MRLRQHTSAYVVSMRQHAPACASMRGIEECRTAPSICQHTSAYVSIRQHTSAYVRLKSVALHLAYVSIRQHTSAYVSIRGIEECQHTHLDLTMRTADSVNESSLAYVSIRQHTHLDFTMRTAEAVNESSLSPHRTIACTCARQHTSAYVSIRQHTSADVSIHQHTSASVSIRQFTPAYASIRQHMRDSTLNAPWPSLKGPR